jgi:hypothetical protein
MALPEQVLASVDFRPIPRRHKVGVKHFTATVLLPVVNLVFLKKDYYKSFQPPVLGCSSKENEFGEFNSCPKLGTSNSMYPSLKVSREFVLNFTNTSVRLKGSYLQNSSYFKV